MLIGSKEPHKAVMCIGTFYTACSTRIPGSIQKARKFLEMSKQVTLLSKLSDIEPFF